jgi:hypothetical protein
MQSAGVTKAQAKDIVRKLRLDKVVRSATHQVAMNPFEAPQPFGAGTWLSVKRLDRSVIDRRDELAQVMRSLLPGHCGFELFPAPERLTDSANQFHVFAMPSGRLDDLRHAPLGPEVQHADGFVTRALEFRDIPERFMVAMPINGLHDWRALYELKERRFPGCEAAMFFDEDAGHPLEEQMLCFTEPRFRFPFGFGGRFVADSAQAKRFGATQRELDSYAQPPVPTKND